MAWVVTSEAAILLTGYNRWGNFSQNPSGEVRMESTDVEDMRLVSSC